MARALLWFFTLVFACMTLWCFIRAAAFYHSEPRHHGFFFAMGCINFFSFLTFLSEALP